MEIVLAVPFAGALFFLGLLAGIRVAERILRARERALAGYGSDPSPPAPGQAGTAGQVCSPSSSRSPGLRW